MENLESVLKNICSVLACTESDVSKVEPIKKGLTNISYLVTINDVKYVYRHPGEGTEEIINRESEAYSQKVAKELELDNTFIHMCSKEGWKLSRFIDNCIDFDYRNSKHVESGLKLVKKLHDACLSSQWEFNIFNESEKLLKLVDKDGSFNQIEEVIKIREKISRLYEHTEGDGVQKRICHNDCYDPNFLTDGNEMYLIDWEYSGNADPASDMGTFICCSDYSISEAMDILKIYFGRELTKKEERHYLAYVAISSYYWYVWALYKTSLGEDVGDYLKIWHDYAIQYGDIALNLYLEGYEGE